VFSGVTANQFTVLWSTNGNPGIAPYEVSMSTDSGFALAVSTPIAFSSGFTANTTTFFGLLPATTYYVRVRAENGNNFATAFSARGSTVTLAFVNPFPAAVTDLSATDTAPGTVRLTWTAPGDNVNTGVISHGQFDIAYTTDSALAQSDVYWSTATA